MIFHFGISVIITFIYIRYKHLFALETLTSVLFISEPKKRDFTTKYIKFNYNRIAKKFLHKDSRNSKCITLIH